MSEEPEHTTQPVEDDNAEEQPAPRPEAEQVTDEQPAGDEASSEVAKVRREAAGYRRKLREAEAERDALAGRLEALQRSEVERLVASGERALAEPSDLWQTGVSLEELRDDDGGLDADKVAAARERVLAERPHWQRQPPPPSFDGGVRGTVKASPSFADELRRVAGGG